MPRIARTVIAGLPHHVTQRGNRRCNVFFEHQDRTTYLSWLHRYCQDHNVDILAYCLMINHVHLVLKPQTSDGLHRALKPLHMRYAQRINRHRGWQGHLWQGRFFSSPLDDSYLWSTVRYVETNPVRAGMVSRAELYSYSSASTHCGLKEDSLLTDPGIEVGDWSKWLTEKQNEEQLKILRRNTRKGLPSGSDQFIEALERQEDRKLTYRPPGRPKEKG